MVSSRIPLSQHSKDVLWSESAAYCQNPACRLDLHSLIERATVGELAHIIPASEAGPRSDEDAGLDAKGRAEPENVLVLCPTCHTVIDKDYGSYPAPTLRAWKSLSQRIRALTYGAPIFSSRADARAAVMPLLVENATVHELYAPLPDVFDDVRADQWKRQVPKVIVPNNNRLLAIINANRSLLNESERAVVGVFAIHAEDLRARHEETDWTPGAAMFPPAMEGIFLDAEDLQEGQE